MTLRGIIVRAVQWQNEKLPQNIVYNPMVGSLTFVVVEAGIPLPAGKQECTFLETGGSEFYRASGIEFPASIRLPTQLD